VVGREREEATYHGRAQGAREADQRDGSREGSFVLGHITQRRHVAHGAIEPARRQLNASRRAGDDPR